MDRLLSEARAELAALDTLEESAHSPAVRVEMHRKARRIDELMWQVQNLVHGGTASLGPGPAPVMGVVVTGPGGEQASAHVGGVGVTVQVDEIGGSVSLHSTGAPVTVIGTQPPPPTPAPAPRPGMSSTSFQGLLRALGAESFADGKLLFHF